MQPRSQRLVGPVLVGAGLLAATAYIAVVDPNAPGHYPMCPLKALTGLDCPGCGGLRAVHSLTHGDLAGAVNHNLLAVTLFIPAIAVWWLLWARREWRGPEVVGAPMDSGSGPSSVGMDPAASRRLWLAAFIVIGIFTIVRNIPGVPVFEWLNSAG